jgi:hypothetical protein
MEKCPLCGALTGGLEKCRGTFFGDVLAREGADPSGYGSVHLLTVDCYALQHSEDHGPRSNAFHLLRLRWLMIGGDPGLEQKELGPIPYIMEKFYRDLPFLEPPKNRGDVTILDVYNSRSPEEHIETSYRWAISVWEAYEAHHGWAVETLKKAGVKLNGPMNKRLMR